MHEEYNAKFPLRQRSKASLQQLAQRLPSADERSQRRAWTTDDFATLKKLRAELPRVPVRTIATILGRTVASVNNAVAKMHKEDSNAAEAEWTSAHVEALHNLVQEHKEGEPLDAETLAPFHPHDSAFVMNKLKTAKAAAEMETYVDKYPNTTLRMAALDYVVAQAVCAYFDENKAEDRMRWDDVPTVCNAPDYNGRYRYGVLCRAIDKKLSARERAQAIRKRTRAKFKSAQGKGSALSDDNSSSSSSSESDESADEIENQKAAIAAPPAPAVASATATTGAEPRTTGGESSRTRRAPKRRRTAGNPRKRRRPQSKSSAGPRATGQRKSPRNHSRNN